MEHAPDTTQRVYLIASGETDWQAADRIQGDTDLPLSKAGQSRVERAAGAWRAEGVRTIYTAPDEASRQTAKAFARAADAKVRVVDALAEMNLGLWQGLERTAIRDRYPTKYARWRQNPERVAIPEGETLAEAFERLREQVARLIDKSRPAPVALVLRPVALGLVGAWLTGRPIEAWREAQTDQPLVCYELQPGDPGTRPADGKGTLA